MNEEKMMNELNELKEKEINIKVIDVIFKQLHYSCLCCCGDIMIKVPEGTKWEDFQLAKQPICDSCNNKVPEKFYAGYSSFNPKNCFGFVDYENPENSNPENRRFTKGGYY